MLSSWNGTKRTKTGLVIFLLRWYIWWVQCYQRLVLELCSYNGYEFSVLLYWRQGRHKLFKIYHMTIFTKQLYFLERFNVQYSKWNPYNEIFDSLSSGSNYGRFYSHNDRRWFQPCLGKWHWIQNKLPKSKS